MKHLISLCICASVLNLSAAVPLRWTVETSRAQPATFDQFAGATYDLEATLQSNGKPLAVTGDPQLYWQTNGMVSAWWTAPATVSGNVLRATWTPACDVGARVYNCFIGMPGTVYNAAFQLRLRPSPGATPNELPLPTPVIDFAQVTVLNPPWPDGVETNAVKAIIDAEVGGTNALKQAVSAIGGKRDKTDLDVEVHVPATDWEITYNPSGWSGDFSVRWEIDPFGTELYGWVIVTETPFPYVSNILSTDPNAEVLTDTVYWAWSPGLEVSRTIAHVEHDKLATTNDLSAVIGDATNASIRAVSRAFRPLHDEHVYVPGAMGPFVYESDTPGLVEAIGDRQPTEYSYGDDYAEYDLYFQYDGYDVNAYGYGRTTDDIVNFNGYGYRYDPDTGDYDQIDVHFSGRREAGEWVVTSDTFARESALTRVRSDVSQIRNMIGGETKVMRQGGEFEYGSGWGYVQQIMDSDRRMWRIRVPKWGGITGMTTNAMDTVSSYFVRTDGSYRFSTSNSPHPNAVMQNVISWYDGWGLDRKLVTTHGIYGSDGTQYADYRIGIFYRDTVNRKKCAIEYDVTQTATAPMSFNVKPVTDGLQTIRSCRALGNNTQYSFGIRYLDLPDFSRTWLQTYSSTYSFDITLTVHVIGLMVEKNAEVQTTNGTIPLNYWLLCDCSWHIVRHNLSTGVDETFDKDESEVVIPWTVTVTCNSSTTMEDLIVPYYRILSTKDPNLYYDKLQDITYRITVTNGCFVSEKVMDGDWRVAE